MITIGQINLTLPFVRSKKERRAIINHIVDKLKRLNISLIDISGEYSHEALIAFTFIRSGKLTSDNTIAKIEDIILERVPEDSFAIEFEVI